MRTIFILTVFFYSPICFAFQDSLTWRSRLKELTISMPRASAEEIIAKARGMKTKYDVNAMDLRNIVVYKLDDDFVLVVNYKSGIPRTRLADPGGGETKAIDGSLISYDVLRID
jgi:hypothetical protein